MTQAEQDELTRRIARLDIDSILCIAVNSLILHDEPSKLVTLKRLSTLIATAATLCDEDTKMKAIDMLRDSADIFERAVMEYRKHQQRN